MTEYWNGGITGVSMNRDKSFLGVVWLAGFALVAQNAFALGLAKDQVVPLNIGGKLARVEALLGNKVPAAIWDPPYTTMAAKEGYKLLVDLAPMDVPYLRNIVAVSEKSLREDSRTMSRFVAARAEGMQFNRNKSKILAKYLRMPLERKPRDDRGRLRNLSPDDAQEAVHRSERDENSNSDDRRNESQSKEHRPGITGRFVFRRAAGKRRSF